MSPSYVMLLDVTTIQGLLLYTILLLHRLHFFQRGWKDMRRIAMYWSSRNLKAQSLSSTLKLSADPDLAQNVGEQEEGVVADHTHSDNKAEIEASMVDDGLDYSSNAPTDPILATSGIVLSSSPSLLPGRCGVSMRPCPDTAMTMGHASLDTATAAASTVISRACLSINDVLPPEILSLIFAQLARGCQHDDHHVSCSSSSQQRRHSNNNRHKVHHHHDPRRPVLLRQSTRTLLRCTLVCRSWYELIAPLVWKSPRVLWSRHWSRFFPACVTMHDASATHNGYFFSSLSHPFSAPPTGGATVTGAGPAETVRTVRTARTVNAHLEEMEDEDEAVVVASDGEDQRVGQDGRLVEYQNLSRAELEGLLTSGQIHEQDRQELDQWVKWQEQERARRGRESHRRRQRRIRRQQQRAQGDVDIHDSCDSDFVCSEESDLENDLNDGYNNFYGLFDHDPSDDETSLMKLVAGFDFLQSILQPSSPAVTQQTQALVSGTQRHVRSGLFASAMDRIRRQHAAKLTRRRLAELRPTDGLPAALPLQSVGQWIQVINLQQETPFSRTMIPHHHGYSVPESHRRRPRLRAPQQSPPQQQEQQQQQQQGGFLRSLLPSTMLNPQQDQQPLERGTTTTFELDESDRLPTRRDFVSDKTLKTIMDSCPNLCRLTISECRRITDQGMKWVRKAPCVARGTLVSLHMAGCDQITDQGLLNLVEAYHPSNSTATGTGQPPIAVPRFESLDLAGCYQISDRGLIPLLEQCGGRLMQLRVSDCDQVSFVSVLKLAQHCPSIQWLDLARSGTLTEECLIQLSERCQDLEWLNLARYHHQSTPDEMAPASLNLDDDQTMDSESVLHGTNSGSSHENETGDDDNNNDDSEEAQEPISDRSIALLCESCPKLQLLDLSYISTISNSAIESLSESAKSLVCLTIIGCAGITSRSLTHLAKLRTKGGKLGCITMGDATSISEKDIEQVMEDTLSGWQKSLVEETNLGHLLGRSWDE